MSIKPDAAEFRNLISSLKARYPQDKDARWWWPDYLFHFTHITNAAEILKEGNLLSRNELARQNKSYTDTADQEVIGQTLSTMLDYVRLYFRPLTPMLFATEGVRPDHQRPVKGKHCPVPVYFLFDMAAVLCLQDSRFSSGNLGSRSAMLMHTAEDFAKLPFEDIYHQGAFSKENRDRIINRRHAEVVVSRSLPLTPMLKRIICRSNAERETLAWLLGNTWPKWRDITAVATQRQLFYRKWNFIERVIPDRESIVLHGHAAESADESGLFNFLVELTNIHTDKIHSKKWRGRWPADTLRIDISSVELSDYDYRIYANDDLVCAGRHIDIASSIPF